MRVAFVSICLLAAACATARPPRPAALDPSNPTAPESPSPPRPTSLAPTFVAAEEQGPPALAPAAPGKHEHDAGARPAARAPEKHEHDAGARPAASYTCPMHPEVVSARPGTCPKCGMKLVPRKPAKP